MNIFKRIERLRNTAAKLIPDGNSSLDFIHSLKQGSTGNPFDSMLMDSNNVLRHLTSVANEAAEIASGFNSTKIKSGLLASAYITAEIGLGYAVTHDVYESDENALLTNGVRSVVSAAAAFGAKRNFYRGNKVAGTAWTAAAIYSVASGAGIVAIGAAESASDKDIADARAELIEMKKAFKDDRTLTPEEQSEIGNIVSNVEGLVAQQDAMKVTSVPTSLQEKAKTLSKKIQFNRGLLKAYNYKGASDTDRYKAYITAGYSPTDIGINVDGLDAAGDAILLAATKGDIKKDTILLNKVEGQIEAIENQGEKTLTVEEQGRYDNLKLQIDALNLRLSGLSVIGSEEVERRSLTIQATEQILNTLIASKNNPGALTDILAKFTNTQDGAIATNSGLMFSALGVLGGLALHKALPTRLNTVGAATGAAHILGVPITSFGDKKFIEENARIFKHITGELIDPESVKGALKHLMHERLTQYRAAFQTAIDAGELNRTQIKAGKSALNTVQKSIENLKNNNSVVKAAVEFAKSAKGATEATDKVSKPVVGILGKLKNIKLAAMAARFGGKLPLFIGAGVGIGAVTLTDEAYGMQREYAAELNQRGLLSDDALRAYNKFSQYSEGKSVADIGVNALDPIGIVGAVVTVGVETNILNGFQNFRDIFVTQKNKKYLSDLNPSMLTSKSSHSELFDRLKTYIPKSREGQPAILHAAIKIKKKGYKLARSRPHVPMMAPAGVSEDAKVRLDEWQAEMDAVQSEFKEAMVSLISTPQNMSVYLNLLPINDRLNFARRSALSEKSLEQFSKSSPEIAQYVSDYNNSFLSSIFGTSAENALKNNPEILNKYIMKRSGIKTEEILPIAANTNTVLSPIAGNNASGMALAM